MWPIFSAAGRYDGEGEEQAGAARLHRGLARAGRHRSHSQGRQEEGEAIFFSFLFLKNLVTIDFS